MDQPQKPESKLQLLIVQGIISLVAVVLGCVLTYHFTHRNTQRDQELQLHREVIRAQYLYLQKMKRFAQIGEMMGVAVYPIVNAGPDGVVMGHNTMYIHIPAAGMPSDPQREWQSLAADIQSNKPAIDIQIYTPFQDVLTIAAQHPWPVMSNYTAMVQSDWNTDDLRGLWLTKNQYLELIIDKYLSMSEEPKP